MMENAEIRQLINGPEAFTPDSGYLLGPSPEVSKCTQTVHYRQHPKNAEGTFLTGVYLFTGGGGGRRYPSPSDNIPTGPRSFLGDIPAISREVGVPPIQERMGYLPISRGWGYPLSRRGWGTLPVQNRMGYPPSRKGWGNPLSRKGWGTPHPGEHGILPPSKMVPSHPAEDGVPLTL